MKARRPIFALLLFAATVAAAHPVAEFGKPEKPFPAVQFWKLTLKEPRPLKVYVLRIDLTDPRVSFEVTAPPEEKPDGKEVRLLRTSRWAEQTGVEIAINTAPWSPVSFEGTPADISGLAAHKGTVYSPVKKHYPVFNITEDNKVQIGKPEKIEQPWNAASGFSHMLKDGKVVAADKTLHPRTGLGVTKDGKTLILMIVDGRQRGVSHGVSVAELGELMKRFGAHEALNLDGGGSSTLVFQKKPDEPKIINTPVGIRLPGTERPVAAHLGVRIRAKAEKDK